jgi:lysophospholipid acyltransferase (LPLAT)-like uncharacterized protein
MKRKITEFILYQIAIPLAALLIRLIGLTFRLRELNGEKITPRQPKDEQFVYGFYHSQIFPVIYHYRGTKMASLASTHRDGEIAARAAGAFGIKMTRGSSTRGGAGALLGLKTCMEQGYDVAFTVDGPRGPVGKINNGIIFLGKLTGKRVVAVGCAMSSKARLTSWDRMIIPLPFTRGAYKFGEPINIPADLKDEDIESYKKLLGESLEKVNAECEEALRAGDK